MTEQLFSVGIQHIKTGERINLEVWAKNVHEATHELHGVIGPYTQYRWTGSGPGGSGPKQRPRRCRGKPQCTLKISISEQKVRLNHAY